MLPSIVEWYFRYAVPEFNGCMKTHTSPSVFASTTWPWHRDSTPPKPAVLCLFAARQPQREYAVPAGHIHRSIDVLVMVTYMGQSL